MSLGFGFGFPRQAGLPPFTPASLFAANEPGVWFDPSDYTTLFQDAAGTTPVTAVEQPVGLMLDKSRGLRLGSELVTNGDFATDTWWTKGTGATISGGAANFSAATGYVLYRTSVTALTAGYYEVTFTVSNYSAGGIRAYVGSSPTFAPTVSANGTYTQRVFTTSSNELGFNAASAFTGSIDNVSIKQVAGSHASQSTSTSRPVLSARKNLLVNTETLSTQNVTVRAVGYVLSFYGTGSITLSGTSTGTLSGTGATDRIYTSFTPTAGTLTLTVSGSVTQAQLEEINEGA